MSTDDTDIRWGLARRLEFIEWRVYWHGRVNRRDLEDKFQISTPQASTDLGRYQSAAPGNIEYDPTEKTYVIGGDFRPRFLKLSPERYLLQLHAITTAAVDKNDTWFEEVPPVAVMPPVARGPEAYVLRAIVSAVQRRRAININYQSLTRTGTRDICPHALAHDGHRWHVRALSIEHGEYRDYVLGRILSFTEGPLSNSDPLDDIEWHTLATLKLTAHPELDAGQRAAIEHDYRMENGALAVKMRLALVYYFIRRNNLDLRSGEIPPNRAQLFLQNFDELEAERANARLKSKSLVAGRVAGITPSAAGIP